MNILQRVFTDVPLFDSGAFSAMFAAEVPHMAEGEFAQRIRAYLKPKMSVDQDGIATIPVKGAMAWNPSIIDMAFFGVEDTRNVQDMVGTALADNSIRGLLLDVDSPGGMMVGGFEVADAIRGATKPVVAWSGGWMTSLAYLIGSQADKVITTRTAQIGSIGTVISFADYTKALEARGIKMEVFTNKEGTLKGTGIVGIPLTDVQRDHIQNRVDRAHAEFKSQVLRARGKIPEEAMRGQSLFGSEGQANNLTDAIGGFEYAKSVLKQMISGR